MRPAASNSSMNCLHRESIAELPFAIGQQLLDLDLPGEIADAVARLLQIQVLLEAHEIALKAQPTARHYVPR